jgi:hypothetical protein
VQVDFDRLGMLTDAEDGRRPVVHGLIFTKLCSELPGAEMEPTGRDLSIQGLQTARTRPGAAAAIAQGPGVTVLKVNARN